MAVLCHCKGVFDSAARAYFAEKEGEIVKEKDAYKEITQSDKPQCGTCFKADIISMVKIHNDAVKGLTPPVDDPVKVHRTMPINSNLKNKR